MLNVFLALVAIAAVGTSLRYLLPQLDVDNARRQCGILVLNVLLPALNIEVIYQSTVGAHLWQIPLAMLAGLLVCVSLALFVFRMFTLDDKLRSALILGCAFGNVTYLGMPLLRGLYPDQLAYVTEIAILCEITVTSSDLITGSLIDLFHHEGSRASIAAAMVQVLKFPLLWSTALAILIRVLDVRLPEFLTAALHLLGQSTSGLMLLVLGMAIKPSVLVESIGKLKSWWPMLVIKLAISPLVVWFVASRIGLKGLDFDATILEAAMPPQLFTLIVADRFGFDTEDLAAAVTASTIISLGTLPVVRYLLS